VRELGCPLALAAALSVVAAPVATAAEQPALERLTLEQALARAQARNPDALIAAAEVRRAEALIVAARSGAMPTLLPTGSYTRIDAARSFMGLTALAADQWNASAPLTVPLLAPQAWAQWAHARDDRRVAELGAAQVWRQVAIAVANAYLTVTTQQRALALAVVARDNAAAHATYTRQQSAAGAVSELDDVRAREQFHVTNAQLEVATLALARAQEALGLLVAGDRPVDAAEATHFALPGARVETERRADIVWLRMRQTAAQNQIDDTYADYLPQLTGVFEPLFTQPPTFIQPRWAWQAQLTLVLPFYDGGLRHSRRLSRGVQLEETSDTLDAQLRSASAELRLGYEAVARADVRLGEAREAALLARRALAISTLRYSHGATTNIEVIDAERQSRDADLSAAVAEDNAQSARLELLAAAGAFP
jgi:multidrug efflux system outer membrane protein